MPTLFRQEAIEKKRINLSGNVSLALPPNFKFFAILITLILLSSLSYLSYGEFTRKERGVGVLIPDAGLIRLNAPQAGVITKVEVSEGAFVTKGTALLKVQSEKYGSQGFQRNQALVEQYQTQIDILSKQLSNLSSRHKLDNLELLQRKEELQNEIKKHDEKLSIFNERYILNTEIITKMAMLERQGLVPKLDFIRQKEGLLKLKQIGKSMESERLTLSSQVTLIESQLLKLPLMQEQEVDEVKKELLHLNLKLFSIRQVKSAELHTPISGKVTGLLAYEGKQVSPNQNMLSIIPDSSKILSIF